MSLTLSTADAALKEFYLPAMREQLNQTNALLMQVEKNSVDIEGRRAVLSLHVSRNSSVGARAEGGDLPGTTLGIGNQGYAEERVPLKYNYGRIQLSGPVIRAMRSDRGSFVRAMESETRGVTNDLKRDVNRQLWNDGSGIIVGAATGGPSTSIILAGTSATVPSTRTRQRQLEVGMLIDIGTTADIDAISGASTPRTIESVSFATLPGTIVVSGAAVSTVEDTDFIFRAEIVAAGAPAGVELTGVSKIVAASGALFNVDPASYPSWVSYVDSNSGTNRSVSENLFASVMHNVEIAGGQPGNQFWSSDGVHRAFANLLTAQKRFTNTVEVKGGFKGLDVTAGGGSVPLLWERDAPANTAFLLNTEHLTQFEMSDWEYMDDDGAVLSRRDNKDAYEATLYKYHELTTDKRNAHGKIADLTEA
jgi:hypothetical protein